VKSLNYKLRAQDHGPNQV